MAGKRISRTSTRMQTAAEKLEKALALRATGHSWAEIAHKVGYKSATVARNTISKALKKRERDSVDELVAVEEEKMRLLERAGFEGIARGELDNIPRIVGVMARRATMLGLDAKNRGEDYSMVDQWLEGVMHIEDEEIEDLTDDDMDEYDGDDIPDDDDDL